MIQDILGYPGKMLSGSKTAPAGQLIVWNANICIKSKGKIWYGDIDVTLDEAKLKALSLALGGEEVYVLREMDGRFENEEKPRYDNAIAIATPTEVWKKS